MISDKHKYMILIGITLVECYYTLSQWTYLDLDFSCYINQVRIFKSGEKNYRGI
jgi:hypothetical protein